MRGSKEQCSITKVGKDRSAPLKLLIGEHKEENPCEVSTVKLELCHFQLFILSKIHGITLEVSILAAEYTAGSSNHRFYATTLGFRND